MTAEGNQASASRVFVSLLDQPCSSVHTSVSSNSTSARVATQPTEDVFFHQERAEELEVSYPFRIN